MLTTNTFEEGGGLRKERKTQIALYDYDVIMRGRGGGQVISVT